MGRIEYGDTQTNTCGKQSLCLSCALLILTVVSLKVDVLCPAYFIGCRWYLLCIHVCLNPPSLQPIPQVVKGGAFENGIVEYRGL